MAACGMSDRPGLSTEGGDPRGARAAGVDCQYFSSLLIRLKKQLHPLVVNTALHFSPLGYHSVEETSVLEESFGQVQREKLEGWKVL